MNTSSLKPNTQAINKVDENIIHAAEIVALSHQLKIPPSRQYDFDKLRWSIRILLQNCNGDEDKMRDLVLQCNKTSLYENGIKLTTETLEAIYGNGKPGWGKIISYPWNAIKRSFAGESLADAGWNQHQKPTILNWSGFEKGHVQDCTILGHSYNDRLKAFLNDVIQGKTHSIQRYNDSFNPDAAERAKNEPGLLYAIVNQLESSNQQIKGLIDQDPQNALKLLMASKGLNTDKESVGIDLAPYIHKHPEVCKALLEFKQENMHYAPQTPIQYAKDLGKKILFSGNSIRVGVTGVSFLTSLVFFLATGGAGALASLIISGVLFGTATGSAIASNHKEGQMGKEAKLQDVAKKVIQDGLDIPHKATQQGNQVLQNQSLYNNSYQQNPQQSSPNLNSAQSQLLQQSSNSNPDSLQLLKQ